MDITQQSRLYDIVFNLKVIKLEKNRTVDANQKCLKAKSAQLGVTAFLFY